LGDKNTTKVEVENELIEELKKVFPELVSLNYKAIVNVALRKLLNKGETLRE
jgi:hypothetical protein